MAKPGIAAAAMFQLFYAWNDYYGPLLYTSENESAWTLSLGLASERRGRVRHPGPLAAGGDPAAGPPPITGAALLALDALDATPSVSGRLWQAVAAAAPAQPGAGPYGPLQPADANGIRLPAGFRSRVVARSGQLVAGTSYRWHGAPDGGACFPDGTGWIYVSNSELDAGAGGASAIRFRATGAVRSAYRILAGTTRNCAGGATPWNRWLSCEETTRGYVYDTNPYGGTAVRRPAMGRFVHEAAACDPVRRVVYMTEDLPDGCLYRFRPVTWGDLSTGTLEVFVAGTATSGTGRWVAVPDPDGGPTSIRNQVSGAKRFNGGEGCYYANGVCWFTTKGDNRVWRFFATDNRYELAYDDSLVTSGTLGRDAAASRSAVQVAAVPAGLGRPRQIPHGMPILRPLRERGTGRWARVPDHPAHGRKELDEKASGGTGRGAGCDGHGGEPRCRDHLWRTRCGRAPVRGLHDLFRPDRTGMVQLLRDLA